MSIMAADSSNGRLSKRRKLSHSSDEDGVDNEQSGRLNGQQRADKNEDEGGSAHTVPTRQRHASNANANVNVRKLPPAVALANGVNKTSMLSLQLAELVAEMTPNYDSILSRTNTTVDRIKDIIKAIPETSALSLIDAERILKKAHVVIPFPTPRPAKDSQLKFEYKQPSALSVRGAVPQRIGIKGEDVCTIAASMPASLFQEKDYLNYRAFYKRAFYLAYIASTLVKGAKEEFAISYHYEDGVEFVPAIRVATQQESRGGRKEKNFCCVITVDFPGRVIPLEKTLPTNNCVRSSAVSDDRKQEPTPFYNSCVQAQAANSHYDDLLAKTIQRCPSFADTCRAGQIWLRQRGLSGEVTAGGFGYREWSILCALLLQSGGHRGQPLFSDRYSTLQLFKAMLQVLATRDLLEPMVINNSNLQLPKSESPVFYDGETGTNILFKMTAWSYQNLRSQAQISLAAVNSKQEDSFDTTFIARISEPLLQYDEVFALRLPKHAGQESSNPGNMADRIHKTLKRGLTDRIAHLSLKLTAAEGWPINKTTQHSREEDATIEIALLLNPDTQSRMVDHGPSADEPEEAAEFRRFWGEKAELRRFKDGSISESIVWSPKQPVILQIVQHLMILHFDLSPSSVTYKSHKLENEMLLTNSSVNINDAFTAIRTKFQQLSSTLLLLEDLPLPIRSVSPADAALRSASLQNPLQPSTANPVDMIIQFDSSTRWPDSLPAIQHTKIAFLVKLGDVLTSNDKAIITRVGLENTSTAATGHLNTSYLDIIYPSPASGLAPICFRARIYHDRELHLLQTALNDKSLHGSVRDSLTSALATHKRDSMAKPLHTTTFRSLCTRFPPLPSTIRLLKKWVSSHLLLDYIPEEALELIAAHMFLRPAPWTIPGSPTTAFLRCLHLLAHWDWAFRPLVIDTSSSHDLTEPMVQELQTRFQAWRKLDPNMNNVVWFVGSSLDNTGTVWTQGSRPPKVVAGRATALARAAMGVLRSRGTDMSKEDWKGLFTSPLEDFDFLIKLKSSVVRSTDNGSSQKNGVGGKGEMVKYKNLQVEQSLSTDTIGFDPVDLFRKDLEQAFGNAAVFFHDGDGGKVIAGLWKPGVTGKKEWRVRLGYSSVPLPSEGEGRQNKTEDGEKVMCEINKPGILAEIAFMGEGLVKEILDRT